MGVPIPLKQGNDSEIQWQKPGREINHSVMVHRNPHQPAGQVVPGSQILHFGGSLEKMLLALTFLEDASYLGRVPTLTDSYPVTMQVAWW